MSLSDLPSIARLEASAFSALNRVALPVFQAGLLSPGLLPAGVIVLEAEGRRSGQVRETPLLAAAIGDYLLVSTVRGCRSQWVKNLQANPNGHHRSGARRHATTATVICPDTGSSMCGELPAWLMPLAVYLGYVAPLSGFAYALLGPRREARA